MEFKFDRKSPDEIWDYRDINRIEQTTKELSELLLDNGYGFDITTKTNWLNGDVPSYKEVRRITDNITLLQEWYFIIMETPSLDFMTFVEANNIERILFELSQMREYMVKFFLYAGTTYSGGY